MQLEDLKKCKWIGKHALDAIEDMMHDNYDSVKQDADVVMKRLNKANETLQNLTCPLRIFVDNEEEDIEDAEDQFCVYVKKEVVSEDGKVYYTVAPNDYCSNWLSLDDIPDCISETVGAIIMDN